jgi:hypothetical protein
MGGEVLLGNGGITNIPQQLAQLRAAGECLALLMSAASHVHICRCLPLQARTRQEPECFDLLLDFAAAIEPWLLEAPW